MSLPTEIRSTLPPDLHVLADTEYPGVGQAFDAVVSLDPLFGSGVRLTDAHVYEFVPARWPEAADSGARFVLVLNSSLTKTVAAAVADGDEVNERHYDAQSMRRAELAANAAEEAAVARAFRGTGPVPAVVVWSDDPRVERLGLPTYR